MWQVASPPFLPLLLPSSENGKKPWFVFWSLLLCWGVTLRGGSTAGADAVPQPNWPTKPQ